jgi:hypothetical protein
MVPVRRKISQTVSGTSAWKLDINNLEQSLLGFPRDRILFGWFYTVLNTLVNVDDNEEDNGDVGNRFWRESHINL